jgi:FlgN protein
MQQNDKKDKETLFSLLSAMVRDMERLYNCLRIQQHALVKCRLDDLNKTLRIEYRLINRNLKRDSQCKELIAEMAGSFSDTVSLKELAQSFLDPWPQRFKTVAERLRRVGDMIQIVRKQNEFLITNARELVNERLHLLIELARLNRNTYEQSGKKRKNPNLQKILDCRL